MLADSALKRFVAQNPASALAIGDRNDRDHAQIMRRAGIRLTTVDKDSPADVVSDYMAVDFEPQEAIWCSHCLEHQRNPGLFLDKIHWELEENGLLAMTVPPQKEQLAGGHVTIWNKTILAYQLVMAGFDCSEAKVWRYGYNITALLRKKSMPAVEWEMNKHDLPRLKEYMPEGV